MIHFYVIFCVNRYTDTDFHVRMNNNYYVNIFKSRVISSVLCTDYLFKNLEFYGVDYTALCIIYEYICIPVW